MFINDFRDDDDREPNTPNYTSTETLNLIKNRSKECDVSDPWSQLVSVDCGGLGPQYSDYHPIIPVRLFALYGDMDLNTQGYFNM